MLPIKPLFFEYFDVDLLSKTIKGKKVVEIDDNDNMVEVTLRIPLQNDDFMEYRKRYYTSVGADFTTIVDKVQNKGGVIDNEVNLVINPFYEFPQGVKSEYNIGLYDSNLNAMFDDKKIKLNFYDKQGKEIVLRSSKQRTYKGEVNFDLHTFIVNSDISYVFLDNGFTKSLLVPKMKKITGGDEFIFAIDFGTTNTHIEYRVNGGIPKPFEIDNMDNEFMLGTLIKDSSEIYSKNYIHDFFPRKLKKSLDSNENSPYHFPQKTSLTNHKGLDFSKSVGAYSTCSIPFKFGIESFTLFEEVSTNLKWDVTDPNNEKKIKSFLEQILKMIRDKVILNNGDLFKTQIVWSYPVSMQPSILNKLTSTWNDLIDSIFTKETRRQRVPESLTPFYYYINVEGVTHHTRPMVSMDIGGKTTDIAIYQEKKPILFTSYKFAGDALFGDNYNRNININGFINKYFDKLINILKNEDSPVYNNVIRVLEGTKSNQKSNDLIDAFFGLKSNVQLKDLDIDFEKYLSNDEKLLSVIFIYFVANIYHLAQVFKSKKIETPKDIKLAGNGAKILNTLDTSKNKDLLSKLVTLIFQEILPETDKIRIELPELSKEISAKGGTYIFGTEMDDDFDIDDINYIHFGAGMKSEYSINDKEELIAKSKVEVDFFLSFLEKLFDSDMVKKSFNIDRNSMKLAIITIKENIEEKLYQGFDIDNGQVDDEDFNLSETLFFYPLVGCLGEIAYNLTEQE